MIVLQADFQPITTAESIFLVALILGFLWAAVKLRSTVVAVTWFFMTAFIGLIVFSSDALYSTLVSYMPVMITLCALSLMISIGVRVFYADRI